MAKFNPPFVDKYSKSPVGSPRDSKNPNKVTDKEWSVRKGEFIYSQWLNNFAFTPFVGSSEFYELRQYAQGRQPTTKYMNILDPKDPNTGLRAGFYNMSWDIVPIFPKYRDVIRGKLSRFDFTTSVQALDDNSQMDREFIKWKSYVLEKNKEFFASLDQAMGGESEEEGLPDQTMIVKPRSLQEMEMIESMGGYRLPLEAAVEKLLYKSNSLSEWDEIKLRMEEDFIDLGQAACQDYTDPVSKIPMCRYVDIEFLIVLATRDNAYTEITDCAEIRFMTLTQLKDEGLSEDEIRTAARSYIPYFNNPPFNSIYNGGLWDWSQGSLFRVAVLDMDFASWSVDNYEARIGSSGQELIFKIGEENVGKDKKKKYEKTSYERRYQGKWVIGTNIICPNFGYQYNQVFDSDNRPKSSYSIYRVSDRSTTSRCISTLDDIQLAVLKFRNAWAKAKPAGLLIEWGSLSGMNMGGKKLEPMDVLKIYGATGDLLYRAASHEGRPLQGVKAPIDELGGGMGVMLNEFITTLNTHIATLGEITGIGRGQDGSLPGGDTLVGVANIAEGATQDTMRPMLMGYKRIKSRVMNNLALRWQLRLVDGDINEYVQGKEGVAGQMVRMSFEEMSGRRIQINCDMIIDDTQKQMAIQAALESIKAAKTGSIGITYADFLVVMQAVERGQVKYAFMWIHYREEQEKKYQAQLQKENMQMNSQGAQQLEQMKQQASAMELQAKSQLAQMEGNIELQKIALKGEEDRKTLNVKYALEMGKVQPVMPDDSASMPMNETPLLSQASAPAPQEIAPEQEQGMPMMS